MSGALMRQAKEYGFSDKYIASLLAVDEQRFREPPAPAWDKSGL